MFEVLQVLKYSLKHSRRERADCWVAQASELADIRVTDEEARELLKPGQGDALKALLSELP